MSYLRRLGILKLSYNIFSLSFFSSSPKPTKFHRPASPLTTGSQRKATFTVGSPSGSPSSSSPLSRGLYNRSPSRNSPSPNRDKALPQKLSPSNKTSSIQSSGKSSPSPPIPILGSSSRQAPRSCDDTYSKSAPIMVPHPRRSSFSSSLKTSQASPSSPINMSPSNISKLQTSPSIPFTRTRSPSGVCNISTSPSPNQRQSHVLTQSPKQSPGHTPTQSPNISPLVAVFSPYSPGKPRVGTEVSFNSLLNNAQDKPIVKARSSPSLSTTGAWALEAKSKRMSPISQFDLKPLGSPPKASGMKNLGCIPYRSPTAGALARVQGNPNKPSLLTNVLGTPPSPSYEGDKMKPLKGIFFGKLF